MTIEKLLRSLCQDRCAEFGDPPCYELAERGGDEPAWCELCERDAGLDPKPEPLDPNAVVRPLL